MKRIAALVCVLPLVGCPTSSAQYIVSEDFETECDGTPCGWNIRGGDGTASYIETIPSDRGLLLEGEVLLMRIGPAPLNAVSTSQLAGRINARCDDGASLEVRATFDSSTGETITFGTEFVISDAWELIQDQTLRPLTQTADAFWTLTVWRDLAIIKRGPGACEVDFVAVRIPSAF
jgi:hypothetical protein